MTQAQRKEYPPQSSSSSRTSPTEEEPSGGECSSNVIIRPPEKIAPEAQIINLSTPKQPERTIAEPAAVRCSVIQRVSSIQINDDQKSTSEISQPKIVPSRHDDDHHFNEQTQPINYHVPKRIDVGLKKRKGSEVLVGSEEEEDRKVKKLDTAEERESRIRDAKRAILHRVLLHHIRRLPPGSPLIGRLVGIVQAAAGHGRSTNNSGSQSNASQNGSSGSSGGSIHFSGSGLGCGNSSGGGVGSGGAGAGGNGRDNRSNYGPNSPPTGSLPPFYESLKGGNGGMNSYNAQNNTNDTAFNNFIMHGDNGHLECDSSGEITHLSEFPGSPNDANSKQYSVLQNVYLQNGMVLKDEIDLDYESKIDTLSLNGNLLQNYVDGYTDTMMADLTNSVDPLQLTATLTFSSSNEHALLESLSDAVDLSQFLQRLPSDEELELSSTPSMTSNENEMNKSGLDSFQDHLINGRMNGFQSDQRQMVYKSSQGSYENPPPYQSRDMINNSAVTTSNQQHNMLHHQMNSYELDSSLPSPTSSYELATSPHQHLNSQQLSSRELQLSSVSTSSQSNNSSPFGSSTGKAMKNRRSSSASSKMSSSPETTPAVSDGKIHVLQQRVS